MSDEIIEGPDSEFKELVAHSPDTKMAPAHGIAAIALSMAMKYHDINMVHDGTLYQQYKMEGRNMRKLDLNQVFETAIKIEQHLLASSERIARIVVDAIAMMPEDGDVEGDDTTRQVGP